MLGRARPRDAGRAGALAAGRARFIDRGHGDPAGADQRQKTRRRHGARDAGKAEIETAVLALDAVKRALDGKPPKKSDHRAATDRQCGGVNFIGTALAAPAHVVLRRGRPHRGLFPAALCDARRSRLRKRARKTRRGRNSADQGAARIAGGSVSRSACTTRCNTTATAPPEPTRRPIVSWSMSHVANDDHHRSRQRPAERADRFGHRQLSTGRDRDRQDRRQRQHVRACRLRRARLEQRFAKQRAQRDAEDHAIQLVADIIRNRLASYFVAGT